MIFNQGAGGTLAADAVTNFASGFSAVSAILCFQGNMNLKSRVNCFSAVMADQQFTSGLGGRSMGARAAVMAAKEETKTLSSLGQLPTPHRQGLTRILASH